MQIASVRGLAKESWYSLTERISPVLYDLDVTRPARVLLVYLCAFSLGLHINQNGRDVIYQ